MNFLSPAMLFLALPCCALMLLLKGRGIVAVLRAATYLFLVLAMARPVIDVARQVGTVVFVADRSASVPAGEAASIERAVVSASSRSPKGGKAGVVSFASAPVVEQVPSGTTFPGFGVGVDADGSDLDAALDAALALIEQGTPGRIAVLTDGLFTGPDPLKGAASRALARGIPIDYRFVGGGDRDDAAILGVDAPLSVAPGSALLATAWVSSPRACEISYSFRRGGKLLYRGTRSLPAGVSPLTFRDVEPVQGVAAYEISFDVADGGDPRLENNRARFLVTGGEGRPLLVVPASSASALPKALGAGGVPVVAAEPNEVDWDVTGLGAYSGIVVENRRADDIGRAALSAIAAWVEHAGGGFALTGGRNSFGQGGYFKSPIEDILPVSMELRNEKRKYSVAVAVALDRSGSMSLPAGGGRTKIDLANIATVGVADMLSADDEMAVFAVDCKPHEIVPLLEVGEVRARRGRILAIKSEGGGIYVYAALVAALDAVSKSTATIRHVILFADASDAEEPRDYQNLLAAAAKAGVTVSVVGLGREDDCDADLLRDVALWGGGTCAFTENPGDIPRLFALDTINVARNALVTNETQVLFTSALPQFSQALRRNVPPLGGYNLCYLQPGATCVAASDDENSAPILALRNYGSGRTLSFAGEADGELSGKFAKGEGAREFYSAMARYVAGPSENEAQGFLVVPKLVSGGLEIKAYADSQNQRALAEDGLEYKLVKSAPGSGMKVVVDRLRWNSADEMSATIPLHGAETVLPVVKFPDGTVRTLPAVCLPYSPEYRPDALGAGEDVLGKVAALTGGGKIADLTSVWDKLGKGVARIDLSPLFYALASLAFLLLVVERRLGMVSALFARGRGREPLDADDVPQGGKTRAAPTPQPEEAPAGKMPPKDGGNVFDKARRRAKGRF